MRILVVRPEPAAGATAARLAALGHAAHALPLTRLVLRPPPAALPDPAALLLTSRNAVAALAAWPAAAAWRGRPAFAVGPGTAAAAKDAGFRDVRAGSGGVAELAGRVAAALSPAADPLLYPAAAERAGDLACDLRRHGFAVHLVEAYAMAAVPALPPAAAAMLAAGTIDAILVYSPRNAAILAGLVHAGGLTGAFGRVTVYALSDRVAAALGGLAPGALAVAPRPDEDALLALLPAAAPAR